MTHFRKQKTQPILNQSVGNYIYDRGRIKYPKNVPF